ncbi:DUF456 domain-containing protein [Propionimicrobium sp. PCR01-08-3]|uniref:DUF456 domain-containing protein n=1 Tax=Propionimicrobium sp. PCR01-08-3 TaxID=3052086 RepID=UPI00255C9D19|nr:DUF456 domain-containing protein [Propionimicrobium sp. PCR01-08-3]WIY81603.1 DUF456 domain-containing protein [Propionimicrobium sp. PCR01-08-3]
MDIAITVITGALVLVGALGTIFPILPGSILVIIGLLVWAIAIGGPVGWTVFALGLVSCGIGMASSYFLTGKRLKARSIPNRSILIGAVVGVIGAFVIPVIGLFVGFVAGLFGSEWYRLREPKQAWDASVVAMKSVGLGMLIEFGCAGLAIACWVVGIFLHF